MEKHLNSQSSESLKGGLKICKGKTKYITNYADSEDILTDQEKNLKSDNSNTSDKPHISKILQEKFMPGSEQRGALPKIQGNTSR